MDTIQEDPSKPFYINCGSLKEAREVQLVLYGFISAYVREGMHTNSMGYSDAQALGTKVEKGEQIRLKVFHRDYSETALLLQRALEERRKEREAQNKGDSV